jgi:hypothetical protein
MNETRINELGESLRNEIGFNEGLKKQCSKSKNKIMAQYYKGVIAGLKQVETFLKETP